MDTDYNNWLKSGEAWMKAYRGPLLRKHTHVIIPAVVLVLISVFVFAAIASGGTGEEILGAIFTGILLGVIVCGVYLLFLLPGLSPKRMSRGMKKAVKLLNLSEVEQEQLGHEMLEVQKDSARVLDYKMVGPNSKGTPAKFILSSHYACLWGSYPLVILVNLSELANITTEQEHKIAVTHRAKSNTYHSFNLYTITFYYRDSQQDADNGMGFFDEVIRDKVFEMIKTQIAYGNASEKKELDNTVRQKELRAINAELASGKSVKHAPYIEIGSLIALIEKGTEDFLILNSHDGFLQFYGVGNQYVMEIRVNLKNDDFRTYSIINKENEKFTQRVQLTTPYGQFTPTKREVLSLSMVQEVIRKYYENISEEDFLSKVPYYETTEETKRRMNRLG